jgi:hypothetical protein
MTAFTEASTFDATVTKIADGDDVSAAITNAPLQSLTDRTRYLYDALVAGATHARTVADAAALRALTSHVSGDLAALGGGNGGKLFLYDAASSLTDDGVLIVKPTDVGGGAGRWLVPALVLLGRENTWSSLQHFAAILATSVSTTGGGTIASDGDLTAVGDCAIGGGLVVGTTCTLVGIVSCTTDLNVGGDLDVTGGIHAGAASLFSSTCAFSSTTSFTGTAIFNGGVTINGNSSLTKRIASSSTGRVAVRVIAGADAATTYGINDADTIIVKALTADRTYTLSETGAANGDVIKFATEEATYICNIDNADGTGAALVLGSGTVHCIEYTYLDGVWRITMAHKA